MMIAGAILGCRPCAGDSALLAAPTPSVEYLSDHPERILMSSQDWGELGLNVAAHQASVPGTPLLIAGKSYEKGLGHHANGAITILLDKECADFNGEVGLQPCSGGGSVIFRAFLDGRQIFDSGPMTTTNAAKSVHLDVRGIDELRLEANDAGDGITCDMANWAEARLVRASGVPPSRETKGVDVAPFGRIVTWDPSRMDGARASRIQEYRAEDVYLEKSVTRNRAGVYVLPDVPETPACIGIQWLNRRAVRQLEVLFSKNSPIPSPSEIQVQGWFGESAWQGTWKRLEGDFEASDNTIVFRLAPGTGAVQTQKIRWLFSMTKPVRVRNLAAYTRSHWETARVVLEADSRHKPVRARVRIINGELVSTGSSTQTSNPNQTQLTWNTSIPLHLAVRSSRPSTLKSDPTIIQLQVPKGAFGVAIEDLRAQGQVYLPDLGVSAALEPVVISLPNYRRQTAQQKTILQQVREMPDQTLSQALAKTHHDAQKEGPVLLSLACENLKFVLERDGTLRFPSSSNLEGDWFATAGEIRPTFGRNRSARLTRQLDGGWLPIPMVSVEEQDIVYRQRTFVVPADGSQTPDWHMGRPSLCVSEYTVTNTGAAAKEVWLELNWLLNSREKTPIAIAAWQTPFKAGQSLQGLLLPVQLGSIQLHCEKGVASLSGQLEPGKQARIVVLLSNASSLSGLTNDVGAWRRQVECYWESLLAGATQIETPDAFLNSLIRSSQVRCLIDARNEAVGVRIAPWIAAMSYGPLESEANSVIRGMDYLGHAQFARRGLDFFLERYQTNGFLTTGYTTFGTAWHLWTLAEHYQLNRDRTWLKHTAPTLLRAGDWIVRQTEKTKAAVEHKRSPEDALTTRADGQRPEYGLMPPGVLADWNSFAYHYAMNAYYYAALRGLAAMLSDLSDPTCTTKAKAFGRNAAELRRNTLEAYRWTQSQAPALRLRNGAWIPHYPSQVHSPGKLADFFPGQDAGRSWCYDVELGAHQLVPTGVFEPSDPEVGRMLEHMEDVQFLADGWFDYPASTNEKDWFNLGGFSKVQPYYTRNCEIYALRDEVKPFVRSYFNTLAAMVNPEVLTFWEHFHHSGAWDKTHETGYFLHQTRTMLVTERGHELWLAPLLSSNWFGDQMLISLSNAPTRFGPVSYEIRSRISQGIIEARISPPERESPKAIVLRLRHPGGKPIRSVEVNGKKLKPYKTSEGLVRLGAAAKPTIVRVFY